MPQGGATLKQAASVKHYLMKELLSGEQLLHYRFTRVTKKDKVIYGDSAYAGEEAQSSIPEAVENKTHEKAWRNKPLRKSQEKSNTAKSRVRARAEPTFAVITKSMNGITVRTIGRIRAHMQNGTTNLTYNFLRYVYLAGHIRWVRRLITA
jgi:IS5 family transposase